MRGDQRNIQPGQMIRAVGNTAVWLTPTLGKSDQVAYLVDDGLALCLADPERAIGRYVLVLVQGRVGWVWSNNLRRVAK